VIFFSCQWKWFRGVKTSFIQPQNYTHNNGMRVQLVALSALLFITTLVTGVNAGCNADEYQDFTPKLDLNGVGYIEKWIINSTWNVIIEEVSCSCTKSQTPVIANPTNAKPQLPFAFPSLNHLNH